MHRNIINNYLEQTGFKTFHPKAVLFDMDGVLIDSMPRHARCWHQTMKEFGIHVSEREIFEWEGMRGIEIIQHMTRRQWNREVSQDEAQRMYDAKSESFNAEGEVPTMKGAEAALRAVKKSGLKIVVVTGSGVRTLLDDLQHRFPNLIDPQLIVSSFDVQHGKPHPEPYLKGLQKANVKPNEAIVVENAPLGVRAAVAAKILTIGVKTGPLNDKMFTDEGASLLFDGMNELAEQWENIMDITE